MCIHSTPSQPTLRLLLRPPPMQRHPPHRRLVLAPESKGWPTMPRHRHPPRQGHHCTSKRGTANDAKAPVSAPPLTCCPSSKHHHPHRHRLVFVPAREHHCPPRRQLNVALESKHCRPHHHSHGVTPECKGQPMIPWHYCQHCHQLVVAPASNHHLPPHRQLFGKPASGHSIHLAANSWSSQQARTAIRHATDSLLHQNERYSQQCRGTIIRPAVNLLLSQ